MSAFTIQYLEQRWTIDYEDQPAVSSALIAQIVAQVSDEQLAAAIEAYLTENPPGGVADDDPRLSDARTPTGGAGGALSGAYPDPGLNTEALQDAVGSMAGTGMSYDDTTGMLNVTSSGVELGETSATAYRGDRGKTAYDHSQITSGNPHGTTIEVVSTVEHDRILGRVSPDTGDSEQLTPDQVMAFLAETGMWVKVESATLASAASSIVVSSLHLWDEVEIHIEGASTVNSSGEDLLIRCNSDTGTNYDWVTVGRRGSTTAIGNVQSETSVQVDNMLVGSNADTYLSKFVVKATPTSPTGRHKVFVVESGAAASAGACSMISTGTWKNTADDLSSITLFPQTGQWVAGTRVSVLGRKA